MSRKPLSLAAIGFGATAALVTMLVGCGQTAMPEVEDVSAVREADGRVTVRAKVYCQGAGDEDCESGGCVVARWDANHLEAGSVPDGQAAIESNRVCWTRTIKKSHNDGNGDHESVTVTSSLPIDGTPQTRLAVEAEGRSHEAATATPPR